VCWSDYHDPGRAAQTTDNTVDLNDRSLCRPRGSYGVGWTHEYWIHPEQSATDIWHGGGGQTPQAEQRGSFYCPLVVSSPACQCLSVVGTIKSVCCLQVMPLSLSLSLSLCVDITIPRSPPTHLSLSPWSTYCTTMLLYRVKSDEWNVFKSWVCSVVFITLSWAYVNMCICVCVCVCERESLNILAACSCTSCRRCLLGRRNTTSIITPHECLHYMDVSMRGAEPGARKTHGN
jgi:hypothetical protein